MSGRRRDFDGTFSQESIKFWQTDPRIRGSKSTVKIFVLYAGQVAVQERRECLPLCWTPKAIGTLCDLDPKTCESIMRRISIAVPWDHNSDGTATQWHTNGILKGPQCLCNTCIRERISGKENSLIGTFPDGRLIIWGTAKRHRNLPFKNTCINGVMQEHNPPLQYEEALYKSRVEKSREEEKTTKDHEPAARPSQDSEDDPKPYNLDGFLMGLMRRSWKVRFRNQQHPRMDRLLKICRARGLSPVVLFDYAKQHFPISPLRYIQSLTVEGDGRFPDNGEQTWDQWVESVTQPKETNEPVR